MSRKTDEQPNYTRRLAAAKQRVEDFKQECEAQQGKTHTPLNLKDRLRSSRAGQYAANGYFHIAKTDDRRQAYELDVALLKGRLTEAEIRPKKSGMTPEEQAELYTFGYESPRGLNNWLSSYRPYAFQAHHLIPDEVISEEVFSAKKWAQLQKLPYDINHGENIMLLPSSAKTRAVHLLPQHNGSHPEYNNCVEKDMRTMRNELKNTDCKNPTPPPLAVIATLREFQEKYFRMLRWEGAAGLCSVNQAAKRQAATSVSKGK